jgi:hypothetical protein
VEAAERDLGDPRAIRRQLGAVHPTLGGSAWATPMPTHAARGVATEGRAGGLEHPVERVVCEQVALLDVGGERGVALVAAELLELGEMHPAVSISLGDFSPSL